MLNDPPEIAARPKLKTEMRAKGKGKMLQCESLKAEIAGHPQLTTAFGKFNV
jgi:hypothetical protein